MEIAVALMLSLAVAGIGGMFLDALRRERELEDRRRQWWQSPLKPSKDWRRRWDGVEK
jgi:hypothetical protein